MASDHEDISALMTRAVAAFNALSPVEQGLHLADQRRSFVRGQCGHDPSPDDWRIATIALFELEDAPDPPEVTRKQLVAELARDYRSFVSAASLSAVPGRIGLEEAAADPHADRGWQDIATAPKDGTPIIGWHEHWDFGQVLCWEAPPAEINDGSHSGCANAWVYADWFQHDADNAGVEPTHWTPLPPPPEHAHPLPGTASAAANQNPSAVKPPVVGQLSSNPGQLEPSTSPREAGLREARDFLHRWAHLISNGPMCRDLEAMAIKGTAEDLEPLRQALSSGDRP